MFDCIQMFLKNVVKVVPFESIAYAIANGNHETAVKCAMFLLSESMKIPPSFLMSNGLLSATHRFETGFPAKLIESARAISRHNLHSTLFQVRVEIIDEDNLVVRSSEQHPLAILTSNSEPVKVNMKKFHSYKTPRNLHLAERLSDVQRSIYAVENMNPSNRVISGMNIESVYINNGKHPSSLNSPIDILAAGRKKLKNLAERARVCKSHVLNQEMLATVNEIRNNELDSCTSLLGGFMDQESVGIFLGKSHYEFGLHAPASVGVWTLFSLDYNKIKPILAKCHGEQLLVKVMDHVKGISGVDPDNDDVEYNPYAAKLQFVAQGMARTVTCNTKYVGYSLERQLVELCRERKINAATSLSELDGKWSHFFKENMLSLVEVRCRPLIARWIKWALMIHDLREELAKYTAVGVVGLVNSGKSKLVSTLFGMQVSHEHPYNYNSDLCFSLMYNVSSDSHWHY